MWYDNNFRRHLCDMHIEEWDEHFLENFSPEFYFSMLKKADVQTAMLYFQSHVGYCYWPTQTGHMHRAFAGREDAMRRLADMCRADGIAVVGYYSLIYNNWAYYAHPEWRMVYPDGETFVDKGERYGLCCPNNGDYRAFVAAQIEEMADYFTFDGMFFDMPFWTHACYCPACQARWAEEVGGTLPETSDLQDERWQLHVQKRHEWMGEFAHFAEREMKKIRPGVTISQNFASAICSFHDEKWWCSDSVNDACDYAAGDLYGGLAEQSLACKFYRNISKNQPFEYMTSRCNPNLQRHTLTKSPDQLQAATMVTCAHHGAMLVIDAIDPDGGMHPEVYDRIGDAFALEKQYEPYLTGEPLEDVGVFYNLLRKGNVRGQEFGAHSGALQMCKTLMEAHIPYGVVSNGTLEGLQRFRLVAVPYANTLSEQNVQALADYVTSGGTLYFSGAEDAEMLTRLLDAQREGETRETMTYVAAQPHAAALFQGYDASAPLPFHCSLPVVRMGVDAEVLATITLPYTARSDTRFASIHADPPGVATRIPAFVRRRLGKGTVLWSAAPMEQEEIADYKRILYNVFASACPAWSVYSDAPDDVELVTFRDGDVWRMSAVNLSGKAVVRETAPFAVRIKADCAAKAVRLLPDGQPVPTQYRDGYVCFQTRSLRIFDMYEIQF